MRKVSGCFNANTKHAEFSGYLRATEMQKNLLGKKINGLKLYKR